LVKNRNFIKISLRLVHEDFIKIAAADTFLGPDLNRVPGPADSLLA
jgi:hypothetical protein